MRGIGHDAEISTAYKSQWFMAVLGLCLFASAANAALVYRGRGLVHDDVLNITWMQDAAYRRTLGFPEDGRLPWSDARTWVADLTFAGFDDWRLPRVIDTGAPGCDFAYSGTDCGYNMDPATSELAHLWYVTLGNIPYFDTNGVGPQPGWSFIFANPGPFENAQSLTFWSGTELFDGAGRSWYFSTDDGNQQISSERFSNGYIWAVRDGDVAAVPLPAALWLLAPALVGLAMRRRRLA